MKRKLWISLAAFLVLSIVLFGSVYAYTVEWRGHTVTYSLYRGAVDWGNSASASTAWSMLGGYVTTQLRVTGVNQAGEEFDLEWLSTKQSGASANYIGVTAPADSKIEHAYSYHAVEYMEDVWEKHLSK
jgi:hypothetical protein